LSWQAQSREEWRAAAKELDVLEENEAWKLEDDSEDYDAAFIEARLKELDEARINCDITHMLYLVRTALSRDLGGMGNIQLYKHSHTGTKDLIERYINSALDTIKALVKMSAHCLPGGIGSKDILEQVVCARQAFGRSALLLSGGATFGMNHVGVLKALYEAHLLPRIISGASAGSIVCAVLCTRTDEEIPELLKAFPHGDLAVFEEEGKEDGLLDRIGRFLTQGAWIDMKHLVRVMKELLGDMTFQEAYNRTRRVLNICVSSASIYELPRLLNYVTSPNVMIWSAVAASCSVPLLFSAAYLLVKNPITGEHVPWNPTPQRWIDGSVDNDLPMTRLAEMFNVNFCIVSQTNPHVVPFLAKDDATISHASQASSSTTSGDWLYTLTKLAKGEALHRMQVLADLGIFPNLVTKARSVLSQKYSGDITILPEINYRDFPRMLKNPTSEFMVQACLCGERATWPKLSRIRNHCAIELELDNAVQQLRARVVFSPSQVDLRRSTVTNRGGVALGIAFGQRQRRVSGSNVRTISSQDSAGDSDSDDDNIGPSLRGRLSRPALRTSGSTFATPKSDRYLPPLAIATFNHLPSLTAGASNNTTSAISPQSRRPQDNQTDPPKLMLRVPVLVRNHDGSEAESTTDADITGGFASSSDADAESRTDSSSPEPDNPPLSNSSTNPSRNSRCFHFRLRSRSQSNFSLPPLPVVMFTPATLTPAAVALPQPPTPGVGSYYPSLALNATMPPSETSLQVQLRSPELAITRSKGVGVVLG
jgi:TAG lipase / steryl ester hydrolase / phospholipase A2 / LPA acyltransferase